MIVMDGEELPVGAAAALPSARLESMLVSCNSFLACLQASVTFRKDLCGK